MNDKSLVMGEVVLSFRLSLCDGAQFMPELTRERKPSAEAGSVALTGIPGLSLPATFSAMPSLF